MKQRFGRYDNALAKVGVVSSNLIARSIFSTRISLPSKGFAEERRERTLVLIRDVCARLRMNTPRTDGIAMVLFWDRDSRCVPVEVTFSIVEGWGERK